MQNQSELLFKEVQRFRQWWVWLLVLIAPATTFYAVIEQIIFGRPFGNNPAPDGWLIVIAIVVGLGLPVWFYKMTLTTEVRADGIYFRFFPAHLSVQRIGWEDIKKYEAQTYNALKDFGGYGIRFGMKGKAYNVSGNRGIYLELSRGRKLLIGSQKPEEFVEAIRRAMKGK